MKEPPELGTISVDNKNEKRISILQIKETKFCNNKNEQEINCTPEFPERNAFQAKHELF